MELQESSLRGRRLLLCALMAAFVCALILLSRMAARYEKTFVELEIKHLPVATRFLLGLAAVVRSPLGLGLLSLALPAGMLIAWRGALDKRLGALTGLLFLGGLALIGAYNLSLRMQLLTKTPSAP